MKKICCFLFLLMAFFSCSFNVFADTISINDVASEFVNTRYIKAFNEFGADLSMRVDGENNLLNVISENEVGMSFNYTDQYIEFDNRDSEPNEENVSETFGHALSVVGLISSLFNLCGYTDYVIEDFNFDVTYDEYGIVFESEHFEYSGVDEDGVTWESSGEYLKYFKISLDSEKISKFAEEYGVPIEDDEINTEFENLIPNIEASEITSNSVRIYLSVDGYDSEEIPHCYIYRSTSEDGEFEKISNWHYSCIGIGVGDDDLNSNTTYYYKAQVVGSDKFSEIISVTTLKDVTVNPEDDDTDLGGDNNIEENPGTGTFYLFLFFMIGIISLFYVFYGFKKQYRI